MLLRCSCLTITAGSCIDALRLTVLGDLARQPPLACRKLPRLTVLLPFLLAAEAGLAAAGGAVQGLHLPQFTAPTATAAALARDSAGMLPSCCWLC